MTPFSHGHSFSADEEFLYVAESGLGEDERELRSYPIHEDGSLGTYSVLHTFGSDHRGPHRGISGMCVDRDGSIIACAGCGEERAGSDDLFVCPIGPRR